MAQIVKNLPAVQETQVLSLGQEDPLEKGKATHSSILAWTIPWIEEPGRLQSMGLQRARQKIEWLTLSQDTENSDNILQAMKSHWKTARQGVL